MVKIAIFLFLTLLVSIRAYYGPVIDQNDPVERAIRAVCESNPAIKSDDRVLKEDQLEKCDD